MIAIRLVGILLIVVGIVFFCSLIAYQYQHCVYMWNYEDKAEAYASALDYFFAVSKGAIAIATLCGGLPAFVGILLCRIPHDRNNRFMADAVKKALK